MVSSTVLDNFLFRNIAEFGFEFVNNAVGFWRILVTANYLMPRLGQLLVKGLGAARAAWLVEGSEAWALGSKGLQAAEAGAGGAGFMALVPLQLFLMEQQVSQIHAVLQEVQSDVTSIRNSLADFRTEIKNWVSEVAYAENREQTMQENKTKVWNYLDLYKKASQAGAGVDIE